MSLTSLIKDSKSPLAEWFAANFAETRRVGADTNQELRGGPSNTPCVIAPPTGTDHGTVGTAVGYILNAHLREDAVRDTTARMVHCFCVAQLDLTSATRAKSRERP